DGGAAGVGELPVGLGGEAHVEVVGPEGRAAGVAGVGGALGLEEDGGERPGAGEREGGGVLQGGLAGEGAELGGGEGEFAGGGFVEARDVDVPGVEVAVDGGGGEEGTAVVVGFDEGALDHVGQVAAEGVGGDGGELEVGLEVIEQAGLDIVG